MGDVTGPGRGPRLLSRVLALAWTVVPAWLLLSRVEVLRAGHPAYPVLLLGALAVGVVLVLRAVLTRRRAAARWRRGWVGGLGRVVAVLAAALVLGVLAYLRPLPASAEAAAAMAGSASVTVTDAARTITLTPAAGPVSTGLVFQPGALVDPRAYVPLLTRVSETGTTVVIVKQPLGIGFTAVGAPRGIIDDHPEVAPWTVGGHSLGGVAAGSFVEDDPGVAGVLFWASYPLGSLADRDGLVVTSVSGTQDGLSTPADIRASRARLPADTTFVAVEGAVHAFFGDYGPQSGDGTATVPRAQAQEQIVEATTDALARTAP